MGCNDYEWKNKLQNTTLTVKLVKEYQTDQSYSDTTSKWFFPKT